MRETRPRGKRPHSHHTRWVCLFSRSLLALCFLFLVAFRPLALGADSGKPKNVLILCGFLKRQACYGVESLESTVRSRVSSPVNSYIEYLESQSFGNREYEKALSATLRASYADKKPDLVMAIGFPALEFAEEYRYQLFPDVPIVFAGVARSRIED